MPQTDPRAMVREMKLAPVDNPFDYITIRELEETLETATEENSANINNRSLVSFLAGVDGQARKDVNNSTLFAQLAADQKFAQMEDPEGWLEYYVELLKKIGWNMEATEEREYTSAINEFDMNKAMLEIMGTAIVPGTQLYAVVTATLAALKSMGEDNKDIKLFERRIEKLKTKSFQLGAASQENGAVAISLSTFKLDTVKGTRKIIFFKGSKDEVALSYRFVKGTFNPDIYGRVRQDIVNKLGELAQASILDIDLTLA